MVCIYFLRSKNTSIIKHRHKILYAKGMYKAYTHAEAAVGYGGERSTVGVRVAGWQDSSLKYAGWAAAVAGSIVACLWRGGNGVNSLLRETKGMNERRRRRGTSRTEREERASERESRRRSETCLVEELGLERGRRARGLKGEKDGWRRAKMGRRRLRSP